MISKKLEIGDNFTKDKGTITIIEVLPRRNVGKDYIYEVKCICSICNKDKEIYPDPFVMKHKAFKKGYYPCGCAKRPLYDEKQYWVVIGRMLNNTENLKILNIVGEYKGSKTSVNVLCTIHNEVFNSNYNFIQSNIDTVGCKTCNKIRKQIRFSLSEDEAIKRIKEKCIDNGYLFLSMDPYTVAAKTFFKSICPKGTEYTASYNNFVNNNHGCSCCTETGGGYNPDKFGWLYVVEWSNGFGRKWIKVGITCSNNPNDRFYSQLRSGNKSNLNLRYTYLNIYKFKNGYIPPKIEKLILGGIVSTDNITIDDMPDGYTECYHVDQHEEIIHLIEKEIISNEYEVQRLT